MATELSFLPRRVSLPVALLATALLASPGNAQGVRVNAPLAHGSGFASEDVLGFQLSPDGQWAAFFADSELGEDVFELFGVPVDGGAAARRLNGPLVAGGNLAMVYPDPNYGTYVEPPHLAISAQNCVVYRGDQDTDEVQELYAAPIDGSAPPVKLSGTLTTGGDVLPAFLLAPDGSRVLFVADKGTDEVFELYSAPLDASAAPVRLNVTPLPGGGFQNFDATTVAVAPDSLTVVYRLDQASAGSFELWSVPIDGSAAPVRLSGTLTGGGDVGAFALSPDGTQVLFLADREFNDRTELWRAPLHGGSPPVRVNGALIEAGDVSSFVLGPDGTRAVYLADQELDGAHGLYSARLVGGTQVLRLSAAPSADLGLYDVRISSDGARVVTWGDALENEVYELFSVPIDGSAAPLRLNDTLVAGGDVSDGSIGTSFQITTDATRVVYWADQATLDVMELWSVPIDRSAAPVRISGVMGAGGDVVIRFRLTGDGSRVLYLADAREDELHELWSAPCDGSAAPLRLSGRLAPGGDVQQEWNGALRLGFEATSDGARVIYRADQRIDEVFSLWSVPADRSLRPRELNAALDPGPVLGDVVGFAWSADGSHVVYSADQLQDEAFQVLSATPDPRALAEPIPVHTLGSGRVFELSPDGAWAAFRRAPSCEPAPYCSPTAGLWGAPVDGGLPALRWDAALGGYAEPFAFSPALSPAGGHLVFTQHGGGYRYHSIGLFSVATSGPGEPVSLTEPPGMLSVDAAWIGRFAASPDGTRVVYHMNQYGGEALWSVPVDRSLPPVAISGILPSSNSIAQTFRITDDGAAVVFVAALTTPGVFELYRAPIDGSAPPTRVTPPLPGFADVDPAFVLHGREVLFVADLERDEAWRLWSVPLDPVRDSVAVALSAKPLPGGGVARGLVRATGEQGELGPQPQFAVSTAAGRVVYLSDELVPGKIEILSAPLDASEAPVRLNAPLPDGTRVLPFGFRFAPAGKLVVFAAPDEDGVLHLHSAPLDGGAPAIPLGGPFVPGGGLWTHAQDGAALSFELTPDGATAVYLADQRTDETFELFAVASDGSAPARRRNRALVAGGDVRLPGPALPQAAFALSPDGRRVLYLADQDADEVFELFASDVEPRRVRPADLLR